ncbi:hypothetical protein BDF19DRAFT_433105 [Syncephalis fuscata]|nr:hypothetical protein BDF19DRAFT_433105 [Syncephalis fuscata]
MNLFHILLCVIWTVPAILATDIPNVKIQTNYTWGQCADQPYGFIKTYITSYGGNLMAYILPQKIFQTYYNKTLSDKDQKTLLRYNYTDCIYKEHMGKRFECIGSYNKFVRTNTTEIPCLLLFNPTANTSSVDYVIDYIKSSEDDADDPDYPKGAVEHDARIASVPKSGGSHKYSRNHTTWTYLCAIGSILLLGLWLTIT